MNMFTLICFAVTSTLVSFITPEICLLGVLGVGIMYTGWTSHVFYLCNVLLFAACVAMGTIILGKKLLKFVMKFMAL